MAFKVGAIVAKLTLDKSDWNKAQKEVNDDQKKMQGMSDKTARRFKAAGRAMTVAGAVIVAALGKMVNKASEAEETYAKFGTIFESVFGEAEETAKDLADSYGLSTLASKDMLAATGDLLTGLGMLPGVALDLSEKTQQLAVDLASFTNFSGGAKGASEALTKAMLGERESIKSLGIVITEEMVKEELLAQGKEKLTGLAEKEAGAEATLAIAYRQSKNAIGDYERTSGSLANQKRLLTARLENLSVTIGTKLIPVVTDIVVKISDVVEKISTWMDDNPKLTATIVEIAGGIGSLMLVLGPLLIIIPKIGAAFAVLTAGPMAAIIAAFVLLAAVALKARKEFNTSMDFYQKEMDITGRKTSWLERTLGSIDAAWSKLALGIDTNAIALQAYNEKMREADGVMSVVKGTGWVLSNGLGFLKDKFVELTTAMEDTDDEAGEVDTTVRRLATGLGITRWEADELRREWARLLDVLDQEVMGEMVEVIEDGDLWLEMLALEAEETGGVLEEVFKDMGITFFDETGKMKGEIEETAKTVENSWTKMSQRMKDTWTRELGAMLSGAKSFKDAAGAVWNEIKRMFADMVAKMIVNFAIDGVKELVGGATKAASGIGSAMESVGAATAPLAAGIGTLITTLAQAIATAAQIIAAAAPAILIAAGVAMVIYAGFKLLQGLFAKKAKPGSELDFLRQITENTFTIKDLMLGDYKTEIHTTQNILREISGNTERMVKWQDVIVNHLRDLGNIIRESFASLPSAQHGAVVTGPTLAALHGTPSDPEIVSPVSKLVEGLQGFGGDSAGMKQTVNVNIMVKDHLDPYSAQRIVREQIVPNMLKAIDVDSRNKTKMREILGVQV